MNAITGIENLIAQPGILNTPYWCAYNDKIEDKNRLRDNYNSQNASVEDAERGLRLLVNDLSPSGCNLCIWFSDTPKPAKGGYRINFYLPAQSSNYTPPQIAGTPAPNVDELITERVNQALESYKREQERKELLDRVKQLETDLREANKESALDRIVGRLEPFADVLIDHYLPDMNTKTAATTAVSGSKTDDDKAQEIAENALAFLADGEPDFHITLQKLAELKKSSPAKYAMAKSML